MKNDNSILWLAIPGRDAGTRCSDMLGIKSPIVALDFDLACAMRLAEFDAKRENSRLKGFKVAVGEAVAELFGAKGHKSALDIDDETETEFSEDDIL